MEVGPARQPAGDTPPPPLGWWYREQMPTLGRSSKSWQEKGWSPQHGHEVESLQPGL